jgi:nucleoside-diphosphate-sugar epimerase
MSGQDTFSGTAFVTGSAGLLGNNLVGGLPAAGLAVRALARSRESRRELGLQFRPVSVTLSDEIQWYRSYGLLARAADRPLLVD